MSFTIPNVGDAAFPDQAEPDSGDLQIMAAGSGGTGVVSGCAVTPQGSPDMTVAVASGEIAVSGARAAVSSGNVTITAANATYARFDLVVVAADGTKSAVAGTASSNPVFPAIPASSVVLAAVYVPAGDTAIGSTQIVDKRVVIASSLGRDLVRQMLNGDPTYRESHPRWAVDASITTVSGTPIVVALPLFAGDVVTNLTFASGAQALVAGTTPGTPHLWFALYDPDLELISQSVDEGNSSAWATFTAKTKALGSPYTATADGVHYAVANVVAGSGGSPTQPTVRGTVGNSPIPAGLLASQKQLGGTCGSGVGATAAAGPLTISPAAYPYCVAS